MQGNAVGSSAAARLSIFVAMLLLVCLLAGCGSAKCTVSGQVTYAGKPVEKGVISFYPAEDRGSPSGGDIRQGRYTVTGLSPGKKKVLISNAPDLVSEPGKQQKYILADPFISNSAAGNQQIVDIVAGEQSLDLQLQPAK